MNYCLDYEKVEEMKVTVTGFLNEIQLPEINLLQIAALMHNYLQSSTFYTPALRLKLRKY